MCILWIALNVFDVISFCHRTLYDIKVITCKIHRYAVNNACVCCKKCVSVLPSNLKDI